MGQFVNTNGDYNIKVGEGRSITLDTGAGVGNVRVTGNLVVEGDTLTVSAENLNVEDNIIILNYGETGNGVTLDFSGIQIDRGIAGNGPASFIYDEDLDTWILAHGAAPGPFNFNQSRLKLKEILTNADTDQGDLTVIGTGSGVIKVGNRTPGYETFVTDDDDVPNKKYVDDAIQNNPTYQIVRDNTRVVAFDKESPLDPLLNFPPSIGPYTSQPTDDGQPVSLVGVVIDNSIVSTFYKNRIEILDLVIFNETATFEPSDPLKSDATVIQALNSSSNIKLETTDTGKVEITYALQLDYSGAVPADVANSSLLHANAAGTGDTGLYYVHSATRNGELISKNRALVFSMLF